jgi:hypothetical protein
MEIKFSRHAKRRAKLYQILESTVISILKDRKFTLEKPEIVQTVDNCYYPLKIIIVVDNQTITVITNYPLKKEMPK